MFILISCVLARNDTLWGTYRPNIYFGTRTRTDLSLLTGLIWFGINDVQQQPWDSNPGSLDIRHDCDQAQKLKYGWIRHDQKYGEQVILDEQNNIEIKTEFVTVPSLNGGDWIVRLKGKCIDDALPCKISMIYYLGFDHSDGTLVKYNQEKTQVHLRGSSSALGDFSFFANGFFI
jgi:mannosyl-oligosaccharide glucosidase